MGEFRTLVEQAERIRQQYRALNAAQGKQAWEIRDYAMGFVGDVGDLQKLVMAKENLRNIDDVDAKLAHELSDCLWSILVVARHYDIDLEQAFTTTMDELAEHIDGELRK